MKTLLMGLVLGVCMAVQATASIVTLDDFNAGTLLGAGPLTGASNAGSDLTGGFLTGTAFVNFGTSKLSYTVPAIAASDASFGGNWLFSVKTQNVTNLTGKLTVTTLGGTASSGTLAFVANSLNNFNYIDLLGQTGNYNITNFTLELSGVGAVDSILATPEPASLISVGCLSLVGGLFYRRKKLAKKA